ncbi:unnamed protein product (mitochondrion) [Plasmodiophora brassicae]|uniref:Membrane-associated protein n=1 Tax=Plasmodiophora brassicae TaxID=37360 RepID=A0A0G4IST8_PLABS|nr:hypothetical protein PBRA_006537 [Plasmodiophora brassicae]SPQ94507.1 unnamed protein product [Plasmodiophora brassicae]
MTKCVPGITLLLIAVPIVSHAAWVFSLAPFANETAFAVTSIAFSVDAHVNDSDATPSAVHVVHDHSFCTTGLLQDNTKTVATWPSDSIIVTSRRRTRDERPPSGQVVGLDAGDLDFCFVVECSLSSQFTLHATWTLDMKGESAPILYIAIGVECVILLLTFVFIIMYGRQAVLFEEAEDIDSCDNDGLTRPLITASILEDDV